MATGSSSRDDNGMTSKYNELAQFVVKEVEQLKDDEQQWWCAITGGPGAGKSTLAAAVSRLCNDVYGISATVIPMDGYHYSKADLRRLDPPNASDFFPRRGSPHTFDAERFVTELSTARKLKTASLPVYSRDLSDPVPNGVHLKPTNRVVFVEGNYLLLGQGGMVPGMSFLFRIASSFYCRFIFSLPKKGFQFTIICLFD